MARYKLTKAAQADLQDIAQYTAERWGDIQAKAYLSNLRATLDQLAQHPNLGKQRPDVSEKALSYPSGSHVIYYLIQKDHIVVFGVLHKRMVPRLHLSK